MVQSGSRQVAVGVTVKVFVSIHENFPSEYSLYRLTFESVTFLLQDKCCQLSNLFRSYINIYVVSLHM